MPPMMPNIDPPDGYINATVNRNKKNITLDVSTDDGRALFLKLAKTADIVVENFRTGTMAQALSGFMHMNGHSEEDPPLKSPTFLADEFGGVHGVMGVLAALFYRERSGEGQHVDIALVDAMVDSCTGLHTLAAQSIPTPKLGNSFSVASPAGAYKCTDAWVFIGVVLDKHWQKFASILGRPELGTHPDYATIPDRVARRSELDEIVTAWCSDRTCEEVLVLFKEYDIPGEQILSPAEAIKDPQLLARDTMMEVTTTSGVKQNIPASSAKFSRTPIQMRNAAPDIGADTEEVLQNLGIDATEMKRLRDVNAI